MATYSTGIRGFKAGEALAIRRCVKLNASGHAVYADAGEEFIGVTEEAVSSGDPVSVKLINCSGTFKVTVAGTTAARADLWVANDGKVNDVASGEVAFYGLGAGSADGSIIEALPWGVGGGGGENMFASINDANDNEAIAITATTSAVNYVTFVNSASGSSVAFNVTGDSTNCGMNLKAKGNGVIELLDGNGNEFLSTIYTASAANEISFKPGATTANPQIQQTGEADIGITFCNKASEEMLILDSIASSVNEITIRSAATGNNPRIDCTGEDDTGITFANKASEEILILDSIASSVNEITIRSAATGNNPRIDCTGEADTGITFANVASEEILIIDSIASSVNHCTISSAATTTGPKVAATGDDTNIDLLLEAKGAGHITPLGAFSTLGTQTQTALTNTATVTAAQLRTRILDGTPTAAATYTLPTAALLAADFRNAGGAEAGTSFLFFVNNKSAASNTITLAGGTGSTDDGTLTVAQNVNRAFMITMTAVATGSEAYLLYGIA
jgi:hypothetical protein